MQAFQQAFEAKIAALYRGLMPDEFAKDTLWQFFQAGAAFSGQASIGNPMLVSDALMEVASDLQHRRVVQPWRLELLASVAQITEKRCAAAEHERDELRAALDGVVETAQINADRLEATRKYLSGDLRPENVVKLARKKMPMQRVLGGDGAA